MKLTFSFTRHPKSGKGSFSTIGDHTGQQRVEVRSGGEVLGAVSDGFSEMLSRQIADLPEGVMATISVVVTRNPPV